MKKLSGVVLLIFLCAVTAAAQENESASTVEDAAVETVTEEAVGVPARAVNEPVQTVNAPIQAGQGSPSSPVSGLLNSSTGNNISLEVKGMEVVDVLKMLAARENINIVVGKNVAGRVTLFLKDVAVRDAFDIVISSNDLAYEQKGGILTVMAQRDYELLYGERFQDRKQTKIIALKYAKAADVSRSLNQMKTTIGKIITDEPTNTLVIMDTPGKIKEMEDFVRNADVFLETRVFCLNYAQADKLGAKIKEALTKGLGEMSLDERTNKIVVIDYPKKMEEIAALINAFDEKTPQVLIDAQIVEIKPSDKFEMGVDWDVWIKKNLRVSSAIPVGTANRLILTTINPVSEKGDYKGVIDLLRTIGDTKILSSPRIMALNNQDAKILVGTKDAYITSSTSLSGDSTVTAQSVNFVDVGIKLYVTPTINRAGFVTMKIKPEISSAQRTDITSEGKITQIPIVSTSESETTVMVKDGVTILIGGLKKDQRQKTVKKIPVLGDIPLAGFFFRSTSDESSRTELVILLTPHIMSGETPLTDFSEPKPVDGAVLEMHNGQIVTSGRPGTEEKK
ncbi:MAG: secretin N-terminal domain-containing protein [Candidatus Omnitrophota bacterium]|jgi:general secretion pathway protein D/type IV pilus assembly protein PilQ